MLRQSGDIDVWLWKEGLSLKENRRAVVEFARTIRPDATGAEHHVGVEWMGTEVELHYEPAYFCNPFANRRFRKWFMGYDKSLFTLSRHGFGVPDAEFNRVFLLAHAFRHYLSEGLGLRQVMDFYFARKGFGKEARTDGLIKDLGMQRFEMAMNWVADFVFEYVEKEEGKTRHRGNQEGHTRYRRSYPPRGGEWHRPRGCSRPWWDRRRAYGWRRRPTSDREGEGRT